MVMVIYTYFVKSKLNVRVETNQTLRCSVLNVFPGVFCVEYEKGNKM